MITEFFIGTLRLTHHVAASARPTKTQLSYNVYFRWAMDCALSDYITFGLRLVQLDASHSMFILLKHTKGKCECHVRVLASVTMAFRWITPGPALSYFLDFSEFLRIYLCQVFCIYIVQNLCVHLRLTTSVNSVLDMAQLGADQCNQCYQCRPICEHGYDAAITCKLFTPDVVGSRGANGVHSSTMRNTLPKEARLVADTFIDSLTNYTTAAPAALPTAEAAIAADFTTIVAGNLGTAVKLARARPGLTNDIQDSVMELLNGTPTAGEVTRINAAISQINHVQSISEIAKATPTDKSASQHLEATYPMATLFQVVVKATEQGIEVRPDTTEMYDSALGKRYVPFARATKCSSGSKLMYALIVFCSTMTQLKKLAPCVWQEFLRKVMFVEVANGYLMGQEFVDAVLRKLDELIYPSITDFLRSGEHNRILDELRHMVITPIKPGGPGPSDIKREVDPRPRIKFGEVTRPLGGRGAGIITNFKTKVATKCNRFHASPQGNCTAGVPAGAGYPADQVGLCAYQH